jgi:hypothetical protein
MYQHALKVLRPIGGVILEATALLDYIMQKTPPHGGVFCII